MKITAVYDNLGKTADRYTVFTDSIDKSPDGDPMRDQFPYLGMSLTGEFFSQWGFLTRSEHAQLISRKSGEYRSLTHLGKLVPFEKLNEHAQRHIATRILDVLYD